MALNERKHTVPGPLEAPSRAAILAGFESINDIVPVADTTERATVAAAVGPTAARPLIVYRADASPFRKMEITEDGATWRTVPAMQAPRAAWSIQRTSANVSDSFPAGVMTSLISGTITAAPAGDYQLNVVLGMSAAAATAGNLRLTANAVNLSEDMRADLGTDVRLLNFTTAHTHAGGNLVLNAQFQTSTQVGTIFTNGSRINAVLAEVA